MLRCFLLAVTIEIPDYFLHRFKLWMRALERIIDRPVPADLRPQHCDWDAACKLEAHVEWKLRRTCFHVLNV